MPLAYLGSYRARLEMPWVRSLKDKRGLITPVIERARVRFPASIARLAGENERTWEVIGAVVLGREAEWVRQVLEGLAGFVRAGGSYSVTEEATWVEAWEEE
jgi:uncharacterized protein YlxP (DUF503 family)